jgi:hypothetical protein
MWGIDVRKNGVKRARFNKQRYLVELGKLPAMVPSGASIEFKDL